MKLHGNNRLLIGIIVFLSLSKSNTNNETLKIEDKVSQKEEDFKEMGQEYINKLRTSGLRPTIQRIMISRILFGQKTTFHFTIGNLSKLNLNKYLIEQYLIRLLSLKHLG